MMLAWRIQADVLGGLDPETRNALSRTGAPQAEGRHLGIGARLTRNWMGARSRLSLRSTAFAGRTGVSQPLGRRHRHCRQ